LIIPVIRIWASSILAYQCLPGTQHLQYTTIWHLNV
jgi:hypothetical protein